MEALHIRQTGDGLATQKGTRRESSFSLLASIGNTPLACQSRALPLLGEKGTALQKTVRMFNLIERGQRDRIWHEGCSVSI